MIRSQIATLFKDLFGFCESKINSAAIFLFLRKCQAIPRFQIKCPLLNVDVIIMTTTITTITIIMIGYSLCFLSLIHVVRYFDTILCTLDTF